MQLSIPFTDNILFVYLFLTFFLNSASTHPKSYATFIFVAVSYVLHILWLGYFSPRTEVVIYVVERSPNGTSRRVPATTLYAHFEQTIIKTQLQQLGVTLSMTRTELSPAQIKQLLQNPPAGMFPESWSWVEEMKDIRKYMLPLCCLVINGSLSHVCLFGTRFWMFYSFI